MKNITVTIDDETYKAARIRAAELGTSVSAMVKDYLQGVARNESAAIEMKGVREMQMPFVAEQSFVPLDAAKKGPEGQPYFVNGKWTFTKDGKPRKPGALRGVSGWTEDWDDSDDWKQGIIDAMYGDDTDASNNWWLEANEVLKKRNPK